MEWNRTKLSVDSSLPVRWCEGSMCWQSSSSWLEALLRMRVAIRPKLAWGPATPPCRARPPDPTPPFVPCGESSRNSTIVQYQPPNSFSSWAIINTESVSFDQEIKPKSKRAQSLHAFSRRYQIWNKSRLVRGSERLKSATVKSNIYRDVKFATRVVQSDQSVIA